MSVFPGATATRDLGELRKLPLIIALALILICVALELGAAGFLHTAGNTAEAVQNVQNSSVFKDMTPAQQQRTIDSVQNAAGQDDPPGLGIPYLALVDGILAYSLALMVLALVLPMHLQAKLQGIVGVILMFFLALACIVLIFVALAQLLLMIGLFFAIPFGTIAYLIIWGSFPKTAAAVILSLLIFFKIASSICLVIAHQRYLKDIGLILMILTSFIATIIVSFLHGLVPGPIVSITDALAAIIVGIIALIWAIVVLIGSIIATVFALTTKGAEVPEVTSSSPPAQS
jgi:hypothetical protein